MSWRQRALGREAEERRRRRPCASASVRASVFDRMRRLPLVHALGAALVDHALGVAEDDVVGRDAHRLDQLDAGDAGRAGAVADELVVFDVAAGEVAAR